MCEPTPHVFNIQNCAFPPELTQMQDTNNNDSTSQIFFARRAIPL